MKPHCCTLPKFKNVSHVIFDLDGTLLDTEKVYIEALANTIKDYEKPFTPDLIAKVAGSVQADVAKTIINLLNIGTTNDEFLEKYNAYANDKLGNCGFMPGAERMVRHLYDNKIPIAVATSSGENSFDFKTQNYKEFFDLFHHIVRGGSDPDVKMGKPAPDIFLLCASRFPENPDPSQCLVFEDSVNGVKAALAAEMQVIMIPEEHVPYEFWKMATLRIDSFEYMVPELFGLPPFPKDL